VQRENVTGGSIAFLSGFWLYGLFETEAV